MSNSYQSGKYSVKTHSAGVNGWAPSKDIYNPSRDNPPTVLRVGAEDALKYHSRDQSDVTKPYWASKGE